MLLFLSTKPFVKQQVSLQLRAQSFRLLELAVADLVLSEVYTLAQHICCFRRVVEHNWVSRDNLYCRIKRVQHHFHALQQYLDAVIACQLTAKVSVRLVPTDRW